MPSAWYKTRSPSTSITRGGGVFRCSLLEKLDGFVSLRVTGEGAAALANTEPGGHRWQQESGKKGQVHTSTITVAVLPEPPSVKSVLDVRDVDFSTCRASGNGGQNIQKTETAVRATHRPTGLSVRCESERSQGQNKQIALEILAAKIAAARRQAEFAQRDANRRAQVGSGQRADFVRKIRTQDGIVTDQRTGRKGRLKDYLKGELPGMDW